MNLFEVIALLAIAIGLIVGFAGGVGEGVWPGLTGALSGAAKGFAFYVVWMLSMMSVLWLGQLYRPTFPRCKSGKCSAPDYRYLSLGATDDGDEPGNDAGRMLARCGCGTLYSRSVRDRRVCEVGADGSLLPYMYHRPFGRWQPDPPPTA